MDTGAIAVAVALAARGLEVVLLPPVGDLHADAHSRLVRDPEVDA